MKKIVGISLSIFLVTGAMVLFTGGNQANAEISNLFKGEWVSYHEQEYNDDAFTDTLYGLSNVTIMRDGTIVAKSWSLIDQAKTEWTPSVVTEIERTVTYTNTSENTEEGYFTYSNSYSLADETEITHKGRCYGMQKDPTYGFTEMRCLQKVTIKGGPHSLDEQNVARFTAKRKLGFPVTVR